MDIQAHSQLEVTPLPAAVHRKQRMHDVRSGGATPYLFILPFGILFVIFFLVPIGYSVYQSLFRLQRSGLGLGAPQTVFSGWSNYGDVFRDGKFLDSVLRMLLFGVVQIPVMLGLALLLALLLDSGVARLKALFRLAYFVPYAIPGIVGALLWSFLYVPQFSPIVKGIAALHLGTPDFLGPNTILWSIVNIVTWEFVGYNMLIIFAALQAIPADIYEAARIDGCTGWKVARYVKIPLVAPTLVLTGVFSIIGTLQLFNEPAVLQSISNNITSYYTPNLYAYYIAFSENNFNYTAALAVVLALVTFVFSFGFLRLTRRFSGV
jgi:multiple sugar transport system permease protein